MSEPATEPSVQIAVNDAGRLHMRNQYGQPVTIPRESLGDALAQGYHPETSEDVKTRQIRAERETIGEQAKTLGEGAIRGATLGLGTAALAELGGDEYREAARERLEINPGVAVVGELGGAIAPALLSGGSSAAASVARAAPVSLAARGGALVEHAAASLLAPLGESLGAQVARGAIKMGAGGLVEGAAYGLGSSLADSALEGTEWTAERAMSGLEHGALYGLAGGAALGAASPIVSKAGRKILDGMIGEGKTLKQAVSEWADKRVVSSVVGDDARIFRRLTDDGADMARLERVADKIRATGVTAPEQLPRALAKQADDAIRIRGEVVKQLDSAGVKTALAPRAMDDFADGIARLREAGTSDHGALADRFQKTLEGFQKREGQETFSDLFKLRSGVEDVSRFARQSRNVGQEEAAKLAESMTRHIDEAADAASPDVGRLWRESQQNAGDMLLLKEGILGAGERAAAKKAAAGGGLQTGLMGALTSLVMSGGATLPAIATGLASSAAHRFVRERGAAALGWIADRVARVELRTARAAERLAGFGEVASELAAKGKVAAVDARDVGERVEKRVQLARAARLGGTAAATAHERGKRYEAIRAELNKVSSDPTALMTRIRDTIAPLAAEQPEVAQAMARRVVADYGYLQSKMPATSTAIGQTLTPGADKPLVSKREQEKLVRYAGALADPVATIEGIAGGEINWEGVDALKERRPELWQSFGARVALETAKRSEPLPYKQRVYLSLLFGFPTDPSMTPEGSAAIQDAAAYQPSGEAPQGPGRGAPSSLDAQAIGSTMATPAQQSGAP